MVGFVLCFFFVKAPAGCGTETRDTSITSGLDTLISPRVVPDSPRDIPERTAITADLKPLSTPADPQHAKRVDSLLLVVQNKDSLIRVLSEPKEAEVRFEREIENMVVRGWLLTYTQPLDNIMIQDVQIDTVIVPEVIRTITVTKTVREVSPEMLVAAVAVGMVAGVAIMELARK